jgi:predicted 2-oxoglutarate/Fe(II)-dependent dioxygenase YbiX
MSSKGFRYITEATHKAPDGTSYPIQIQNPNPHKLSAIDTRHDPQSTIPTSRPADPETALLDDLYSKIFTHLRSHPSYQDYVKRTKCGEMQGLNPRMRILKYDAKDNDRFEAHFDATTYVSGKSQRRKSLITMLLYLNDGDGEDFEGGETLYLDYHDYAAGKPNYENAVKVVPKAGRVAIFEHDLYHSGAPLGRGTKYIMRTDILFNAKEDCDEEVEEGTPKNINTEIVTDEDHKVVILVSDICKEIKLNSEDVEVLSDMDLLDSTCEALIAPGTTIMQKLLLEGGIAPIFVNSLIERAIAAVEK